MALDVYVSQRTEPALLLEFVVLIADSMQKEERVTPKESSSVLCLWSENGK